MRLVVDTNIWISWLLNPSGPPSRIRGALESGLFVLVMSEPLFTELALVLARPRFANRYGILPSQIAALIALLRERSEVVQITGALRLCRDADDDAVIETALVGRADALVTRDDDLKVPDLAAALSERGVTVLTVRRVLEQLGV